MPIGSAISQTKSDRRQRDGDRQPQAVADDLADRPPVFEREAEVADEDIARPR